MDVLDADLGAKREFSAQHLAKGFGSACGKLAHLEAIGAVVNAARRGGGRVGPKLGRRRV